MNSRAELENKIATNIIFMNARALLTHILIEITKIRIIQLRDFDTYIHVISGVLLLLTSCQ